MKPAAKTLTASHSLFLSLPITPEIAAHLAQGHPPTLSVFIGEEEGLYIEKRLHEGVFYLGKTLPSLSSLADLKATELHLESLLHRILSEDQVKKEDFVLFAIA